MNKKTLAILTACSLAFITSHNVTAYTHGAPLSSCGDMFPQHVGSSPRSGESPFKLNVSKNTVKPGETISLKISGNGVQFKGFIVSQLNDGGASGKFTGGEEFHVFTCAHAADSVTHKSSSLKSEIAFEWTAPESQDLPADATVRFVATVVKDYVTFYTDIQANIVIEP